MTQFADSISSEMGRPVIDQTGLRGTFDFDLRYTFSADLTNQSSADIERAPSLSIAIQEQLGLKLQPTRGRVEVLAIDSAMLPMFD